MSSCPPLRLGEIGGVKGVAGRLRQNNGEEGELNRKSVVANFTTAAAGRIAGGIHRLKSRRIAGGFIA